MLIPGRFYKAHLPVSYYARLSLAAWEIRRSGNRGYEFHPNQDPELVFFLVEFGPGRLLRVLVGEKLGYIMINPDYSYSSVIEPYDLPEPSSSVKEMAEVIRARLKVVDGVRKKLNK
jgi:hypothetical protein